MGEVIEKLEELYDEHYWQAEGLRCDFNGLSEWHDGFAHGVLEAIELIRKLKDAP